MRVVIVTNEHDQVVSVPKREAVVADLLANGVPSTSIYVVDFNQVRNTLPISQCPCVFIQFDGVTGDFDPGNVMQIISAIQALDLPV